MPEAAQSNLLPQLSALLNNPWWKHFIAVWLQERERCRNAVCEFPVTDVAQLITMLQTRGSASSLDEVVRVVYEKYDELVEIVKESERE